MKRDWPGRREMCWVIWSKMCCVFKLMRFQSLCGRKKRIPLGMTVSLGVDADCHGELHWARMSKHTPISLNLSLSFPSVLQLTSSALLSLSIFFSLSFSLAPYNFVSPLSVLSGFLHPFHFFLGWGGSWTLFILLKLSFPQRMCQTRTLMHIHTCKCTHSHTESWTFVMHRSWKKKKKRSA